MVTFQLAIQYNKQAKQLQIYYNQNLLISYNYYFNTGITGVLLDGKISNQ